VNFIPKLDGVVTQKVFSKDEVKKILDVKISHKEDGLVYSLEEKEFVKGDYRKVTTYNLIENIDWIKNRILECASQVNINHWKFNITKMLENLKLMKYEKDGWYDWHIDIGTVETYAEIPTMRKISYSILLNDNFKGGNLEFQGKSFNNTPIGTGIFFPSYLIHKVSPVILGTRSVLVGWIHGQPFS